MIEVNGAPGTLYANETYQLQVDFPEHYPMEAPQVSHLSYFGDSMFLFVICFVYPTQNKSYIKVGVCLYGMSLSSGTGCFCVEIVVIGV